MADTYPTVKISEHRLAASIKAGRRLHPKEIVHHLDGDKTNFDPDNLEICSGQHVHGRHHRKTHLEKVEADAPLEKRGDLYL